VRIVLIVLLLLLAAVIATMPFVPGLRELRKPKDAEPLKVDLTFVRRPRYFGTALRDRIRARLEEGIPDELPARVVIEMREAEILAVHRDLDLEPNTSSGDLLTALGVATLGAGARVRELYAVGGARIGPGAQVRALACDGEVRLLDGARVLRWVDADGNVFAEPDVDLGVSASAAGVLGLSPGCTFKRVWGHPIWVRRDVSAGRRTPPGPRTIERAVIYGRGTLALPDGIRLDRDVVSYDHVEIGRNATIMGTIKAHGDITLGDGVRVAGDLVARRDVTIGRGCRLLGDVFAERNVSIGHDTRVGRSGGTKTVFAAERIRLEPGVAVIGWVIAERGGLAGGPGSPTPELPPPPDEP
jgi:acetyltransferase-like isoleucine patch superfamily enzyme